MAHTSALCEVSKLGLESQRYTVTNASSLGTSQPHLKPLLEPLWPGCCRCVLLTLCRPLAAACSNTNAQPFLLPPFSVPGAELALGTCQTYFVPPVLLKPVKCHTKGVFFSHSLPGYTPFHTHLTILSQNTLCHKTGFKSISPPLNSRDLALDQVPPRRSRTEGSSSDGRRRVFGENSQEKGHRDEHRPLPQRPPR